MYECGQQLVLLLFVLKFDFIIIFLKFVHYTLYISE